MEVFLLVEDAVEWARALARALRDRFPRVQPVITASMSLARRYIQREDMDIRCVVQDIYLLDGIGLDLLPVLKKEDVPVVVVTGNHTDELLHKSIELGADFYFVKPIALSTIIESVANVVNNLEPDVREAGLNINWLMAHAQKHNIRFTPKEEAILEVLMRFKSVKRTILKANLRLTDVHLRVLQHRINTKLARLKVNWRIRTEYGKSVRILGLPDKKTQE